MSCRTVVIVALLVGCPSLGRFESRSLSASLKCHERFVKKARDLPNCQNKLLRIICDISPDPLIPLSTGDLDRPEADTVSSYTECMRRSLARSRHLQLRAERFLPGGVDSPVRAFRAVGGDPPFITHAEGAYLFDEDGNRYLDFFGSWGPMILGHAFPPVTRAIQQAAAKGASFGAS